ncbi:hypothetical protein [Kordia sp.]|uniref:hypothetical protein n=1 Tax=Kordia sp. TaxID=1965332 RepID=UPI0025C556AE|nr:hypothetical protein [Kordia sp.]MCH2195373.1 hypothetical protein [Kordia sp.]
MEVIQKRLSEHFIKAAKMRKSEKSQKIEIEYLCELLEETPNYYTSIELEIIIKQYEL